MLERSLSIFACSIEWIYATDFRSSTTKSVIKNVDFLDDKRRWIGSEDNDSESTTSSESFAPSRTWSKSTYWNPVNYKFLERIHFFVFRVIDPVTGQLAPPKVVVPVLASQSNYPGYEPGTTSFGFFNPITPSQPQPVSQNVLAAQQTASLISSLLNPVIHTSLNYTHFRSHHPTPHSFLPHLQSLKRLQGQNPLNKRYPRVSISIKC